MKLNLDDQRHLDAAEGWLHLGNLAEATEELECITPSMRVHPFVLRVRWGIYAKAGRWEEASEIAQALAELLLDNPWGYIQWAFSLHKLKRTKEARDVLLPIAGKFPGEVKIFYNLARYCCQLGNQLEAMEWLEKAIDLEGKHEIRLAALDEPDLQSIWVDIAQI
ncbi:MAG TPA: tetratricopeptide repeat protein [Verrucomicrobiae bacterium]|nr:tetratricopeptide repeat protein [Verrucomicrobiae bacterium]